MKIVLVVFAFVIGSFGVQAQYKAPSQYFRKDFPAPKPGGQQQQPPATPKAPEKPVQPKFKDVALNSQFYFLSDTNRAHAWTKISATAAKNVKTGTAQTISGEIPIQR
jgi:hypothetical protein